MAGFRQSLWEVRESLLSSLEKLSIMIKEKVEWGNLSFFLVWTLSSKNFMLRTVADISQLWEKSREYQVNWTSAWQWGQQLIWGLPIVKILLCDNSLQCWLVLVKYFLSFIKWLHRNYYSHFTQDQRRFLSGAEHKYRFLNIVQKFWTGLERISNYPYLSSSL